MVNLSHGGAAFLCPAADAPAIGEYVELTEMFSSDAQVRAEAPGLPHAAEILRIDSREGATHQVAVRFTERPGNRLTPARTPSSAWARSIPTAPPVAMPVGETAPAVKRAG